MSVSQRYLAQADACERLAHGSARPDDRDAFLAMAAEWRRLAQSAERPGAPRRKH